MLARDNLNSKIAHFKMTPHSQIKAPQNRHNSKKKEVKIPNDATFTLALLQAFTLNIAMLANRT